MGEPGRSRSAVVPAMHDRLRCLCRTGLRLVVRRGANDSIRLLANQLVTKRPLDGRKTANWSTRKSILGLMSEELPSGSQKNRSKKNCPSAVEFGGRGDRVRQGAGKCMLLKTHKK